MACHRPDDAEEAKFHADEGEDVAQTTATADPAGLELSALAAAAIMVKRELPCGRGNVTLFTVEAVSR